MAYAKTPENQGKHFSHREAVDLLRRRYKIQGDSRAPEIRAIGEVIGIAGCNGRYTVQIHWIHPNTPRIVFHYTKQELGRILTPLACRRCGCTDEIPCPQGCQWWSEDVCSSCAPPELGRAHLADLETPVRERS